MMLKITTGLAFSAACLTAIATIPAHAQMTGTYGAPAGVSRPQTYQSSPPPDWSAGPSAQGDYAPQPDPRNIPPRAAGTSGAQVVTNGPQTNEGDVSPSWSARQNVVQSQRYERLLETNRGFREARMRKECGPITDTELRQQCLASFHQDEPFTGSSTSRRSTRSELGR